MVFQKFLYLGYRSKAIVLHNTYFFKKNTFIYAHECQTQVSIKYIYILLLWAPCCTIKKNGLNKCLWNWETKKPAHLCPGHYAAQMWCKHDAHVCSVREKTVITKPPMVTQTGSGQKLQLVSLPVDGPQTKWMGTWLQASESPMITARDKMLFIKITSATSLSFVYWMQ